MNSNIQDYIIKTTNLDWKPLIEKGVHYKGVFIKSLRPDKSTNRSTTILLKFEQGANYPYHNHPAGEELLVLDGSAIVEGATLHTGDYLYTPPGFKHAVTTKTGCSILLVVPEEVEIL
ncbi:cupin domain-containing protein [Algoriphagus sp.]|uniref:cupin domain-containing protein n=1 Tax=Algoriphagus sp. TaxID=1872435 RepID=UPI003F708D9C